MNNKQKGFQPIPNPYIVGKPIEDRSMFFGRLDDFDFIRKKVSGAERGGIIVLCGSRRSGKTSILFQIKKGRLGEDFIPVLIDMQSITVRSDEEFLSKLVIEVVSAVQDPDISFEEDYLSTAGENPHAAFQNIVQKISGVLKDKKLIIMFDEYELFESHISKGYFSTDILDTLSSWMEHRKGVFLIFTGSDRLESRKSSFWDRFMPKAIHRRISFISQSDTFRLIREPVRGIVTYEEGVPEEIYKLTAGQPFYTQVICQSTIDHLNENQKYHVSLDDIHEVVKYIIENPLPQMIFAWNSLSDYGKFILSIIAEISKEKNEPVDIEDICQFPDEEDIGYSLDSNKVREYAEKLFHADYLVKKGPGKKYLFKMDLWRRWIVLMHSIWQVINELGSEKHELEEGITKKATGKASFARKGFTALLAAAAVSVISYVIINTFFLSGSPDGDNRFIPPGDSTTVTIDSEPPGALVFLNNKLFGQTPLRNMAVETGTTAVRLQLEGHKTGADTLIFEKDLPLSRSYDLIERTGSIKITSKPPGAKIFIDRESTGKTTPATIEGLSVNRLHRLVLRSDGYADVVREGINVNQDETSEFDLKLSARTHPLTVESTPHGAEIYLDGVKRGVTPKSFPEITEGVRSLKLVKSGYESKEARISVPAENDHVSMILDELMPATVILQIIPWADLYVDGVLLKKESVSRTVKLKEGTHLIELKHPDYGVFADTLEVKSGAEITRQYMLREMSGR